MSVMICCGRRLRLRWRMRKLRMCIYIMAYRFYVDNYINRMNRLSIMNRWWWMNKWNSRGKLNSLTVNNITSLIKKIIWQTYKINSGLIGFKHKQQLWMHRHIINKILVSLDVFRLNDELLYDRLEQYDLKHYLILENINQEIKVQLMSLNYWIHIIMLLQLLLRLLLPLILVYEILFRE